VSGREAALWDVVRENLAPFGHFTRVENRVEPGTPDVNYALNGARGEGWIELKDESELPKRATTIVRIDHVTDVQRAWWRRRAATGAAVFVLVRLARGYYLLDGMTAARVLGRATLSEIASVALVASSEGFPKLLILQQLTRP
jgi:hypothetical protein